MLTTSVPLPSRRSVGSSAPVRSSSPDGRSGQAVASDGTAVDAATVELRSDFGFISIPGRDAMFSRLAAREIAAIRADGTGLRAGRRALRAAYPDADLHHQADVRFEGRSMDTFFAYRDGRHGSTAPADEWWHDPGTARGVLRSGGRLSAANPACSSLLGIQPDDRRGLTVADVLPPAIGGELSATGGSLAELGEITSTTVVRRRLGEHLRVDFHAVWDSDGAGRHEIAFRPLGQRDAANHARAIGASPLAVLPQPLREELLRGARVVDLAQGERLRASLTEDRWVAVVVSGIVRLHLAGDPIEASLMYGRQGSLVGTHWSVPNQPIALGLQAVTRSSVLLLGARRFDALAATNEELARLLLDEGRAMLSDLVGLYGVRTCGTLTERLAREILLMSDLQGGSPFVPVTEQQLADAIGSIRESVGRALADLRASAWLATTRYGLVILCRDSLARLASSVGI